MNGSRSSYFFDLYDGVDVQPDKVGREYADLTALREHAELTARGLAARGRHESTRFDPRELRVRDLAGRRVMVIALRYVDPAV